MDPSESEPVKPWQFDWKRPRLAKPISTEDSHQLHGAIPIECKSARLTSQEAHSILRCIHLGSCEKSSLKISNNYEDVQNDEFNTEVLWDDQDSSSKEIEDEIYILTVTILASKVSVTTLQILQEKGLVKAGSAVDLLPADTILIEVNRDVSKIENDHPNEKISCVENDKIDEIETIMSKVMQWPESALIDIETSRDPTSLKDKFSFSWQSISNNLRSKISPSSNERVYETEKKLKRKAEIMKHRIGLNSFALCRRICTSPNGTKQDFSRLDVDEMYEVFDRISLQTFSMKDACRFLDNLEYTSNFTTERKAAQQELVMCCLSNNGKIHIFNVLDILLKSYSTIIETLENKSFRGIDKEEIIFGKEFENFLFGCELQTKLNATLLPLSCPIATIPISVVEFDIQPQRDLFEYEIDEATRKKNIQKSWVKIDASFHHLLDLSFLNSNIDPRSMHYRTVQNMSTFCVTAFEHIVIAGKGVRANQSIPRRNDPFGECHNISGSGGFVTLISLKHLVEARTIFLPFAPKSLSPIIWNGMQLILVTGLDKYECLAIRTDASSCLIIENEATSQSLMPVSKESNGTKKQRLIKRFDIFQCSFVQQSHETVHDKDEADIIEFPISVASITTVPPCIILCRVSITNISLNLNEMIGMTEQTKSCNTFYDNASSISCFNDSRYNVTIAHPRNIESLNEIRPFCITGKGWSWLSVQIKGQIDMYVVMWEGTKDKIFYEHLGTIHTDSPCLVSNILPVSHLNVQSINTTKPAASVDRIESQSVIFDTIKILSQEYVSTNKVDISELILQKCPSWVELYQDRDVTHSQVAVASIRTSDQEYFFRMRKNKKSSDNDAYFQDILSWLCRSNKFITAGKIALTLLGDIQTLQELSTNEYEWKLSTEILDGIVSIQPETSIIGKNQITNLSDMIIACLVRIGMKTYHALSGFLARNQYYNTSKACLLLTAMTTLAVNEVFMNTSNANFSLDPMIPGSHHVLWPIQCLLQVAVTRTYMPTTLLLLNATIPNELRNNVETDSDISIDFCTYIIQLILTLSPISSSILLNLVYRDAETFWTSISSSTRLKLCLIQVKRKYPLLLEMEVRQWIIEMLQNATGLNKTYSVEIDLPDAWLQNLSYACLCNAQCDLTMQKMAIKSEQQKDKDDLFRQFEMQENVAIKIIDSSKDGVDFDILIPTLLILEKRHIVWHDGSQVTTKSLLNVACSKSTMPVSKEAVTIFDFEAALKQCTIMHNIEAAASLIGGNNGFVLKCSNLIIFDNIANIPEAEKYLIGIKDDISWLESNQNNQSQSEEFILTDKHHTILWYLHKYVFNAKTFGDYRSTAYIDPTFAASIAFRAWICLCHNQPKSSSIWLENWLKRSLKERNKHFAYATICRSLIFTSTQDERVCLGELLGFSNSFLVTLSRDSKLYVNIVQ